MKECVMKRIVLAIGACVLLAGVVAMTLAQDPGKGTGVQRTDEMSGAGEKGGAANDLGLQPSVPDEGALAYWRTQLRDVPALALPTDRPRPAIRSTSTWWSISAIAARARCC